MRKFQTIYFRMWRKNIFRNSYRWLLLKKWLWILLNYAKAIETNSEPCQKIVVRKSQCMSCSYENQVYSLLINNTVLLDRSSLEEVLCKENLVKTFSKFTGKHLCQSLFSIKFIKKETLAQVFSCEFWEISKSNFFYKTPPEVYQGLLETSKTESFVTTVNS